MNSGNGVLPAGAENWDDDSYRHLVHARDSSGRTPVNRRLLHPWNLTPKQAIDVQERLRSEVVCFDRLGSVRFVAGMDAGFEEGGRITCAAIVVLSFPALELVEGSVARLPTDFPLYSRAALVPGSAGGAAGAAATQAPA